MMTKGNFSATAKLKIKNRFRVIIKIIPAPLQHHFANQ